jgi:hypothetical protein
MPPPDHPGPLPPSDVVVGLLTENTSRMLTQATRLLRSIRWFGGELARARVVACGVGPLESRARETLEALGAEIRTVSRFHPANPTANRHQLLAELLDAPQEVLFVLDCDTIVVRDPLPYLRADAFQAKVAAAPTVSEEVFQRLFAHFGLPKPSRSHVTSFTGEPTIPYFNAGVLVIPTALARTLAPVWRKYNQVLADQPELTAPCQRHMHQASLALALAETGTPCVELPNAMNFQINATHIAPPPGFAETDPVILHYHHLGTEDGFLLPCPYPGAQARIEMFHGRMRAEGFVQEQTAASAQQARPVIILGMHRSGTSVVAQLINALGIYAGEPHDLAPPDMFNPTGFWEHRKAVQLDGEILATLGSTWTDVATADVSRLALDQRAGFVGRARDIVQSLQGHGPFLLKDPRMSLLFPLWREAIDDPICVIVWRDPIAVARSLATRDKRPLLPSIAAWEHYTRTILRDTEGIPRLLVSYDELLTEPMRVTRELHAALSGLGIESLSVPCEERIRQIVKSDFNRSRRGANTDETLLDFEQRALLAGLRTGTALHGFVAPTPARSLELLAEFGELEELRAQVANRDRDDLLDAVFASRSWRLGHGLTGLLRLLRSGKNVSALDRWRELKRRT